MSESEIPDLSDEPLSATVGRVIAAYQHAVLEYQDGQSQAVGFLVGKVMKETYGEAEAAEVQREVRKQLDAL